MPPESVLKKKALAGGGSLFPKLRSREKARRKSTPEETKPLAQKHSQHGGQDDPQDDADEGVPVRIEREMSKKHLPILNRSGENFKKKRG